MDIIMAAYSYDFFYVCAGSMLMRGPCHTTMSLMQRMLSGLGRYALGSFSFLGCHDMRNNDHLVFS